MMKMLKPRLDSLGVPSQGQLTRLSGGDSGAQLWRFEADEPLIVKRDSPERIQGEAEGLRVLSEAATTLVVPRVVAVDDDLLVMQALDGGGRRDPGALGEGLRQLHATDQDISGEHGWPRDNACGATPQPNAPLADGRVFQRERRLLPLTVVCREQGLLDQALAVRLERVADELENWLADVSPALVHGDLWSGNVLFTARGPAIIDPAIYRHYPAVDVAMLTLFGNPGEAFFEAYWDGNRPADWPRLEALFQLYPLLNHLYLFGGAYQSGVARAVDRVLG